MMDHREPRLTPSPVSETDIAAPQRNMALELERIRLGLRKAARQPHISTDAEIMWQHIGIFPNAIDQVRRSLLSLANTAFREMKEQTNPPVAALEALRLVKDALVIVPVRSLPGAIRELLRATVGPDSAAVICDLQAAGLTIVPEEMLPAVRCLTAASPTMVDAGVLHSQWGIEWRIFADTVLVRLGLAPDDLSLFLWQAPIAAVDRYISTLTVPPRPEHWAGRSAYERRYLTARTHPLLLDKNDLLALNWLDELERRKRARDMVYGTADGVIDPGQSEFHQRAAFWQAHDLTLARSFEPAWVQIMAFGKPPEMATPIQKEVLNLRVYLMMIRSGDKSLNAAIELLTKIKRAPVAAKNLQWVQERKRLTVNDRGPAENPYLVLGVAHGASPDECRRAWMTRRSACKDDLDALSAVNKAWDQIRELNRDGSDGLGRAFVVPLDPKFLTEQPKPTPSEPKVLARRTNDSDLATAIEELRSNALHELLVTADTHHRGSNE
jgi:hypothetical protein